MELILQGEDGEDLMELDPVSLDADEGTGDAGNDFELVLPSRVRLEPGMRVFAPGTSVGGVVAGWSGGAWVGPTWTGLLQGRAIATAPGSSDTNLKVSGEANAAVRSLVEAWGLSGLLRVSTAASGINVSHTFDVVGETGYDGICEMLWERGAKLRVSHDGATATLECVPATDWSKDEEWDTDQVDVSVRETGWWVNHLVCRGVGEGSERLALDLYADSAGRVSRTRTLSGWRERQEPYDYSSADEDRLVEDGTKRLRGYWADSHAVTVTLGAVDGRYDVGDIVGGRDARTGAFASARLTRKVTKAEHGSWSASYSTDGGAV